MKTRIYENIKFFDNPTSLEDFERQFRGADSDKRIKFGELVKNDGSVHEVSTWFRFAVDCVDRCSWQVRKREDGTYEVDMPNGTWIYPAHAVKLWIKDFENCCGDKFDIYLIKDNVICYTEYDSETNVVTGTSDRLFEVTRVTK